MLTKLDDTLWHQIPATFDHAGTSDPRFYDRYWFCIYDPAGGTALQVTMGQYTNMNVMDGGVVVVRGTTQYNLRPSRALRPDFEPVVGPLRIEVIEPLQSMRLVVDPGDHPIALDLLWEGVLPVEEEHPHYERVRGRVTQEYQRFNQVGRVSGHVIAGGERIEVQDWWGARDHSWGVRPGIGIPEPETGEPGERPSGNLFCFRFFGTDGVAGHVQIAERGERRAYLTGLLRDSRVENPPDLHVTTADLSLDMYEGTRRFRDASIDLVLDGEERMRLDVQPLGSAVAMPGLGYGGWDDGGGLGVYRGREHVEFDTWDVSHPADVTREDGTVFRPPHRIAPVRVAAASGGDISHGTGSLTLIAEGTLPQYRLG